MERYHPTKLINSSCKNRLCGSDNKADAVLKHSDKELTHCAESPQTSSLSSSLQNQKTVMILEKDRMTPPGARPLARSPCASLGDGDCPGVRAHTALVGLCASIAAARKPPVSALGTSIASKGPSSKRLLGDAKVLAVAVGDLSPCSVPNGKMPSLAKLKSGPFSSADADCTQLLRENWSSAMSSVFSALDSAPTSAMSLLRLRVSQLIHPRTPAPAMRTCSRRGSRPCSTTVQIVPAGAFKIRADSKLSSLRKMAGLTIFTL